MGVFLHMHVQFCSGNTNPEEGRVALSVVAHSKVVGLRPQDLHDVLVELGLFLLPGKIGSFYCTRQSNQSARVNDNRRASQGGWVCVRGGGGRGGRGIMNYPLSKGSKPFFMKPHKLTISPESHCDSHREEGTPESSGNV